MDEEYLDFEDLINNGQNPVTSTIREEIGDNFVEPEEPNPVDFSAVDYADRLGELFDSVQPREEIPAFSEADESELSALQMRSQRLAPIQQSDRAISQGIAGNPFSIRIGPGLRQLGVAAINKERRKRMYGTAEQQQEVATARRDLSDLRGELNDEQIAEIESTIDRHDSPASRYSSLARRKEGVAEAKERGIAREESRTKFIRENTADALKDSVKTKSEREMEQLKTFNKYQLQERLFTLRGRLEDAKSRLGSPNGRSEYASAVNAYARTFLQMAETYDNDIKAAQSLIESQSLRPGQWYYTPENAPEGTPPELIAPEGTPPLSDKIGDPQYLELQKSIKTAKEEKQKVLNEALNIYESSTVLNKDTRVYRPPTEADKEMVEEMIQHGFEDDRIKTFAEGLGFRYNPEEFDRGEVEEPEDTEDTSEAPTFTTVDEVFSFYQENYNMDRQQLITQIMNKQGLSTEEEALRYLERNIQQ